MNMAAMTIAKEATITVDQSGVASVDELHSTERKRFTVL
jgi:hypothetical protein